MSSIHRFVASIAGMALAVSGTAVASLATAPAAQAASTKVTWVKAKVIRWVDGDTVVVRVKGKNRTVRLIGVDTPERGRKGYTTATNWAKRWAGAGTTVRLGNPASVDDRDRYNRQLRYVVVGSKGIGRSQIVKGAKARYDGRDGYDWHPRQSRYRSTDAKYRDYRTGSATGGSTQPTSSGNCPASTPIKGNQGSPEWIYHMPGQRYYDVANAEECFATRAAAERAGYRAAKV
jgi:endonuclease YncB( thermonuclease family)